MNTADHRIAEVERYIHELAIALSGLPADEREDVIAGIREHIDDSLLAIADPTPADVQRVLDELGDPLAIAADAGAPAPPPGTTRPPGSATTPPLTSPASTAAAVGSRQMSDVPVLERDWVPMAVIGSFALAGLFFWLGGPVVALALWLLGLVGLFASPLWQTFEKLVGGVAFIAGPGVVLGLWLSYVPDWAWFRDTIGPRQLDIMLPRGYGSWPRLVEFATAGIVIATLAVVSAWLLSRGSARARSRGSSRAADPTGD